MIYVASSWRNEFQPAVVSALRDAGHEVYDFKHPTGPDSSGFHWSDIDRWWKKWSPEQFRSALQHPIAERGLAQDSTAMHDCSACVLVLPCGRSAHLEAGWFIGNHARVVIFLQDGEPELMYGLAHDLVTSLGEMLEALEDLLP